MTAPHVRRARPAETDAVARLLSAALLEPPPDLSAAVTDGRVHVVADEADATPVGCLVRLPPAATPDADAVTAALRAAEAPPSDPETWRASATASHVDAVAVARGHRGRGLGRALVTAAGEAVDAPLTAAFRPGVRPFYEALGFRTVAVPDGDRLVGWQAPDR